MDQELRRQIGLFAYSVDLVDQFDAIVFNWAHADWRKAYRKHGVAGVLRELVNVLTETNVHQITVWHVGESGASIEQMLLRHGIKMGGRGLAPDGECLTFFVKARQRRWAEYVLARNGTQVQSVPAEVRTAAWAARYSTGDMPADRRKGRRA